MSISYNTLPSTAIDWRIATCTASIPFWNATTGGAAGLLPAGTVFREYTFQPTGNITQGSPVAGDAAIDGILIQIEVKPTEGHFWGVVPSDYATPQWIADLPDAAARTHWILIDDVSPASAAQKAAAGGDGGIDKDGVPVGPKEPVAGGSGLPWWLILAVPVGLKFGLLAAIGAGAVTLAATAKNAIDGSGDKP